MTDAELSDHLISWGDQSLTKTDCEQAHDAAARKFAERNLTSKDGGAYLDVNGVRYSLGEDLRVRRSLPL